MIVKLKKILSTTGIVVDKNFLQEISEMDVSCKFESGRYTISWISSKDGSTETISVFEGDIIALDQNGDFFVVPKNGDWIIE